MQGIYEIKNKIDGKIYIGQSINIQGRWKKHLRLLKQGYDSTHLQRAWDKYGKDNFEISILEEVLDRNLLNDREIYWIKTKNSSDRRYGYNISGGGGNIICSDETRKKIRESCKNNVISEETRKKMIASRKGYRHSEETKIKISKNHADFSGNKHPQYGKHRSEETKRKISIGNKGKKLSKESIEKMVTSRKGYRHSEETKIKISESNKGKIVSKETREKISKSTIGRIPWNKGIKLKEAMPEEIRKKIGIGNKGKTVSQETRKKLSEIHKGKHLSEETKKKLSKIKTDNYKNNPRTIAIINKLNENKSIEEISKELNVKPGVVYTVKNKIKKGIL